MDLDSVADELYAASPDEFVDRRKERVTEARATKDRQLVKDIGALRRPTRSAWLVNVLSRESPTEVSDLLALGAALGDAQQRASGPDLRRLSKERHAMLETLTRRAARLGAEHGHTATEATRQEVSQTLQAALSDPSVAALVRAGRVIQPATYGGFGPMDLFGMAPASAPSETASVSASDDDPAETPEERPEDPARVKAEAAVQAAAQAMTEAREAVDEAERAAGEATTRADELADRVEGLRGQLEEAEMAEREAGESARTARKQHQQAQKTADSVAAQLAEAKQALEALAKSSPPSAVGRVSTEVPPRGGHARH